MSIFEPVFLNRKVTNDLRSNPNALTAVAGSGLLRRFGGRFTGTNTLTHLVVHKVLLDHGWRLQVHPDRPPGPTGWKQIKMMLMMMFEPVLLMSIIVTMLAHVLWAYIGKSLVGLRLSWHESEHKYENNLDETSSIYEIPDAILLVVVFDPRTTPDNTTLVKKSTKPKPATASAASKITKLAEQITYHYLKSRV